MSLVVSIPHSMGESRKRNVSQECLSLCFVPGLENLAHFAGNGSIIMDTQHFQSIWKNGTEQPGNKLALM